MPLTVLAPSKEAVRKRYEEWKAKSIPNIDAILNNPSKDEDVTALGVRWHVKLTRNLGETASIVTTLGCVSLRHLGMGHAG